MGDYQIIVRNAMASDTLAVITNFSQLSYSRTENAEGTFQLTIPDVWDVKRNAYAFDIFNQRELRIEVWRSVGRAVYLDGDTVFFLQSITRKISEDGKRQIVLRGSDAMTLLTFRGVAYASGKAQTTFNTYADDAIKKIVRENLGSSATDTNRDFSKYMTVQADVSLAPTIKKSYAWRNNILKVMQEVASASADAGTYLVFDIVWTAPTTLEFRTYPKVRGVDRTTNSNLLLLDPDLGNLTDCKMTVDYDGEVNFAYALGQGEGTARDVGTSGDTDRISTTLTQYKEKIVNVSQTPKSDTAALQDEADTIVRLGRPRQIFSARLVQTPSAIYGRDFRFGDAVAANFANQKINARISTIAVSVQDGQETINVLIRADNLL